MPEELSEERVAFLARDYCRGFIDYCGYRPEVIRRGTFQSRVDILEHHRQQDGFIHAGVMATMADHTAGYAAFTTVPEEFQILTIEFKVNFLRPAFGNALRCRSRVIREGSQIIISESEVFDQREGEETLAAKALVTLMAVPRERLASKAV
ncbi:MAG: PaaI family thioesterase [Thermodesulfobacteriota bacterium]